jgi:hypothetical protein
MYRNHRLYLVLGCTALVLFTDSAGAFPRRIFRRSSGTTYSSGGIKYVAPKSDSTSDGYRPLRAYFGYDRAMDEDVAFDNRLRVFLLVNDEEVLKVKDSVVAEVKFTDLSNSAVTRRQMRSVEFHPSSTKYQLAVFDVANEPGEERVVEPGKVYRMFVNLHRRSDSYGRETAIGKLTLPYYVAPSDETRLGRARQHIAMRTFKEFYYAQNGWASEENYPMDCYAYYMWATGSCTVGAQNGRTILDRLFGGRRPFHRGDQIVNISKEVPIHGDYVRIPGHSFMLLAYDAQAGQVWTMEGNFNSTIEIAIRSVDSGWTVGHLVDEHVRPGLFQVSRATSRDFVAPPL